ncbi:efflux RND transporter permease subunit [Nitriliruptor alkaliphilus]|uniref:efflux RND transporter permease subunit n=1 Tax=Nitriliruptor alkaliphilus TaxID=427918 RepID=UPI000698E0C8|nr:MMPL family transporter [Nitriliruptor alkaliphilus]
MTRLLDTLARAVRTFPGTLVLTTVVLTAVFGALASQAVQEAGFENFAPDNEVATTLATIGDTFGTGTHPTQLVVQREGGGALLDGVGVEAAAQLRDRIQDEPAIADALADVPEGGAVLTYADLALGGADAQGVEPGTLDAVAAAELHTASLAALPPEQAAQVGALLGGDDPSAATVGAVVVLLDGQLDESERLAAVRALLTAGGTLDGIDVRTLDFLILADEVNEVIEADLGRLLALAFAIIVGILVAIYRRVSDVVASVLGLVFTIVWMQGASVLVGPGFLGLTGGQSEMSMVIPILLVGLGVDYGIHLTMRYREERGAGADPADAAGGAIEAVGAALLLATMTTVVGFSTNVFNPLPPLQDFGIFAAIGVIGAFVVFTTFVPSVRVLLDRRAAARGNLRPERRPDDAPTALGRLASALAPMATRRPVAVLIVAGLLTLAGGLGATQLSTEFSQTEFFPSDSEALATIELVQAELGGDLTERTSVLVTGSTSTPGSLAALDAFERAAGQVAGVRGDGRAQADSVLDRAIAAGLIDPSDIDSDADIATVGSQLAELDPTLGAVLADGMFLVDLATNVGDEVDELQDGLAAASSPLADLGFDTSVASDGILIATVMDELRASQISGLAITLLASMAILALAFWVRVREPLLGVLAIVAVGIVVAWTLGLMALVGIPFNVMTAVVSALAIGIGVPFGIHVVNRFIEDRDREPDLDAAMVSTLRHTGGALIGSATTTVAGFGVLVLSTVPPFRQFGAVVAMTIALALVASVAVLPAMLAVYTRLRPPRGSTSTGGGGDEPTRAEPVPVG